MLLCQTLEGDLSYDARVHIVPAERLSKRQLVVKQPASFNRLPRAAPSLSPATRTQALRDARARPSNEHGPAPRHL